jgi:hypothetical protein
MTDGEEGFLLFRLNIYEILPASQERKKRTKEAKESQTRD